MCRKLPRTTTAEAPAFASKDRRFTAGLRGKQRDRLVVTVRNFVGKDLQKRWEFYIQQPNKLKLFSTHGR
jgi:hypothetical protein